MNDDALRTVKAIFASYVTGDTEGLLGFTTPETVCRFPGDPAVVPWAGTYVGRDFAQFHARVKDHLDVFEYVVERFEPLGDTVLVFAKERCRVKSTGKHFVNEHVGIATIRDGYMVRYLEYSDTAALQAAFTE